MAAALDNLEGNDVRHGALPELLYRADPVVCRNEERAFGVNDAGCEIRRHFLVF